MSQHRASRSRRRGSSDVPSLCVSVPRTVRFEEVDAVRFMWHGRYASWLEDGREVMGRAYGVSYLDFRNSGVVVPLKLFHLDFHHPLLYGQTYTIHAELFWNEAAVLDFEYHIEDAAGLVTTTASTTQLMLDLDGNLLISNDCFDGIKICDKLIMWNIINTCTETR